MTDEYLIEKKVEYLVNMRIQQIANLLESSVNKIQALENEVGVLRNKIERLNMGSVQQTISKKELVKEANSRTGEFQPSDVSIEKMFYYGNKG